MSELITPIFSFYYNKSLKEFNKLPLNTQLLSLDNYKVIVLDYYGISPNIIYKFPKSFKCYFIDIKKDKVTTIESLIASYDVVYVITYQHQCIKFTFTCINLIYDRKKLIETAVNII